MKKQRKIAGLRSVTAGGQARDIRTKQ